jgi:hypothetical protein
MSTPYWFSLFVTPVSQLSTEFTEREASGEWRRTGGVDSEHKASLSRLTRMSLFTRLVFLVSESKSTTCCESTLLDCRKNKRKKLASSMTSMVVVLAGGGGRRSYGEQ